MQLEDYFDFEKFESPFGPFERIRLKGHRIAIEHVIELYQKGKSAEKIVKNDYPTLSLEEVNAAIQYYETNKAALDEYLRRGEKVADAYYQEHLRKPPSAASQRIRELKNQLEKANGKVPPPA